MRGNGLRFAPADENVIAKRRHGARQLVEMVVRVIARQNVYKANDIVEFFDVIICPGKDQAVRCRSPQLGRSHPDEDQILRARGLDLADHFFLHLSRVELWFHEAVSVNVSRGRVPV